MSRTFKVNPFAKKVHYFRHPKNNKVRQHMEDELPPRPRTVPPDDWEDKQQSSEVFKPYVMIRRMIKQGDTDAVIVGKIKHRFPDSSILKLQKQVSSWREYLESQKILNKKRKEYLAKNKEKDE